MAKGKPMSTDPRKNSHAWDEKCWEASMIIASGGGEEIVRRYKDPYSTWVHFEAVNITTLHYGERPIDND